MKLLVIAVLLTIVQAAPPIPRKTANADASKTQSIKQNPNNNQGPSLPPIAPLQTIGPNPNSKTGDSKGNEAASHTVTIAKPVSVSVARDWIDYLAGGFSFILLLVGICGVRAAYKTLRAIQGQLAEMKAQREAMQGQLTAMQGQVAEMAIQSGIAKQTADATRDSVDLVIKKERARIMIVKPEKPSLAVGNFVAVEFRLLFYGTTPAYEVKPKVNCVLSQSRDSFMPFIPHGIFELPSVVSSSDIKPSYREFLQKPLTLDEITLENINTLESFIHFAGTIKYNDFMDQPRETAFHYRWNAPDASANAARRWIFPEGWEEVGGEKENYYT